MVSHYWLETDRWVLKEAVMEAVAEGHRVKQIVRLSDEEILVLIEEAEWASKT